MEIDSTFYGLPTARTVEQWRERTPKGFTFTAKLPQRFTHAKMLLDAEDDRKAIDEITAVWNRLVIDHTAKMEEWMPVIEKLLKHRLTIYSYFNNHYAGAGYSSVKAFSEILERISGKGNAEIARPAPFRIEQNAMLEPRQTQNLPDYPLARQTTLPFEQVRTLAEVTFRSIRSLVLLLRQAESTLSPETGD